MNKFKLIILLLILLSELHSQESQIIDLKDKTILNEKINEILPKNWLINDLGSELEINGPEILAVWPISLPYFESEDDLFKEYGQKIKVSFNIKFQRPVSNNSIKELLKLKESFEEITYSLIDHKKKEWHKGIKEYGFVRLPDYKNEKLSIFTKNSILGYKIRSKETVEVIEGIEKILSDNFEKINQN